jgi:hypothetical protein
MSWTCTTAQARTLDAILLGARDTYAVDWDTAGRAYGTPDDVMIPCELVAVAGGRAVGTFYITPDGTIPGSEVACRTARDLKTIGESQK